MFTYILKRLLAVIPILFVVTIVIFTIIHLTPGDPATYILGKEATEQQVEELREQLGLNEPLIKQYFNWLGGVLRGDLGTSYFMDETVLEAIISHLQPTISLIIFSETIALMIAIPIGIAAARRRGTLADQTIMSFSLLGLAIPSFLLGLFFILLIGVKLQWLPVAGYQPISEGFWNHIKHLIMPSVSMGIILAALIARMTRSSMLEVLNSNYIRTARAKGLKERIVIYRHSLRNAMLPVLTVIGQSIGFMIAGAVAIETIFNIPGIGQLVINSVERRDYAVIQGVVLLITFLYIFINLIIDILYTVLDPRVRIDRS